MNITYLPFVNDAGAKAWRENLENDFLTKSSCLTDEINAVRAKKQNYPNERDYYQALHEKKRVRQLAWVEFLAGKTAALLIEAIEDHKKRNQDDSSIIVGALPEFFWVDINDNHKHDRDIKYYHKPLYEEVFQYALCDKEGVFQELTKTYKNLILFAGTAMSKKPQEDTHNEEKIYNTLLIYADGKLLETWRKHHISDIDGFNAPGTSPDREPPLMKDKKGSGSEKDSGYDRKIPVCTFKGVTFAYDICLDFCRGGNGRPLSSALATNADVNVLIAGGMPLNRKTYLNTLSTLVLRCDAIEYSSESCATVVKCDGQKKPKETTSISPQANTHIGVCSSIQIPGK